MMRVTRGRAAAAALLAACSVGLTACGSDSDAADGDGSSGGLSGDPIKLGMISDVGTYVDFTDGVVAAKAAVRGVNTRGGIDGRPVELVFCNENLDPNTGAACVRKMIDEKVMAMVGTQIVTVEPDAAKLFEQAGIANVGPIAYSAFASDPNSYLISGGQQFINGGAIKCLVEASGPKLGWLRQDIPFTAAFADFYDKTGGQLDAEVAVTAPVPPASVDLGPQAVTINDKDPDGVLTNASAPQVLSLMKALKGVGSMAPLVTSLDLLSEQQLLDTGADQSRFIFVSPFPSITDADKYEGLKQMQEDLKAEAAAGTKDVPTSTTYMRTYPIDSWLAVNAVAKIADDAGATDSAAFKKAIEDAKDVDMGGVIPPWTPSSSVSKAFPRVSYGGMFCSTAKDGALVTTNDQPLDVAALVDASS